MEILLSLPTYSTDKAIAVKTGTGWSAASITFDRDTFFVVTNEDDSYMFDLHRKDIEALQEMLTEALRYMSDE